MNTEIDFWTPSGWRRELLSDEAQVVFGSTGDWDAALEGGGYHRIAKFGDTDNYNTQLSVTIYKHDKDKYLYVEFWGADYGLTEFMVKPEFCTAFLVDKLPGLIHQSGLQADEAIVDELKALRKVFAAFVRHEHGTHVVDEEGEQTLEERRAADERWRQRQRVAAERKKAKQAEDAA